MTITTSETLTSAPEGGGDASSLNPQSEPKRPSWGLGDVLICFAWGVVAVLVASMVIGAISLSHLARPDPGSAETTIMAWILLATAVALALPARRAARRKGRGSLRNTFGFTIQPKTDIALGVAIAAGLHVVLLGVLAAVHMAGLRKGHGAGNWLLTTDKGVSFALAMIAAVVIAPVVQELFVRGLLLGALLKRLAKYDVYAPVDASQEVASPRRRTVGIVVSVLISAALTSGLSLTQGNSGESWVFTALQGTLIGLVCSVVAVKTRRLGVTIIANIALSVMSIATVLLFK